MLDGLEDLEATRRRREEEARRQRREEVRRRREARRRSSSSSAASRDLLASSPSPSPSPSPPPSPPRAVAATARAAPSPLANAFAGDGPAARGSVVEDGLPGIGTKQGSAEISRPKKMPRMNLGDSDSDSEDDIAALRRRAAEREKIRERAQRSSPTKKQHATMTNPKQPANRSHLWGDDDDESDDDGMDVRQQLARSVAKTRAEESVGGESIMPSVEAACSGARSEAACTTDGDSETTPKMSNANARSGSPRAKATNNADRGMEDSTKGHLYSAVDEPSSRSVDGPGSPSALGVGSLQSHDENVLQRSKNENAEPKDGMMHTQGRERSKLLDRSSTRKPPALGQPGSAAGLEAKIKQSSGDIEPVTPTNDFAIDETEAGPRRYIIYMAIRERGQSDFARGLKLCEAACHEELKHCLQMDGTRHVTMFDGTLTGKQVCNLSFDGNGFDSVELEFNGWCEWDAGCYLKLTKTSEDALRGLLGNIDGLPSNEGKRPCDHLSLYRKRPQTMHPQLKREFGKIRDATRSLHWGTVQGVSVRLKPFGGPYEECMILANARSSEANNVAPSASFGSEHPVDELSALDGLPNGRLDSIADKASSLVGCKTGNEHEASGSTEGAEVIVIGSDDDDDEGNVDAKPRMFPESICFLDAREGTLHDTHPLVDEGGGWLWARGPRKESDAGKLEEDVHGFCREFQRVAAGGKDSITSNVVLDLAVRHRVLCGKWIIFQKTSPALIWEKLRDAVFDDRLGPTAKISDSVKENGCFLICIYCPDFTDKREVLRVRQALHQILDNGGYPLYFKPDCFTYVGIDTGNPYKVRPSIYTCGGKYDRECSVLVVNEEKCTHQQGCPRCFPQCNMAGKAKMDEKKPAEVATAKNPPQPNQVSASSNVSTDPIVGKVVRAKSNVDWSVQKKCLLVRAVGSCSPKDKVAGFDLDGTLVNWRCSGWPSRPEHYELWNSTVVEKLRQLHDDGYKLVIFSNQGGVRGAFNGKKAGTVKGVIDWIAKLVDRPLYAVCSTKKDSGYHKDDPRMWEILEEHLNSGQQVRPDLSFFVGDADGTGANTADDPQKQQYQQSGVDKQFAENVGKMRNTTMPFHTPDDFFGQSNVDRRRTATTVEAPPAMPPEAAHVRAALLGGYLNGPILLVLVGVQGSGKSTFCQSLVDNGGGRWQCFSQDTIKNGRPGTRQAVEEAAREAIRKGKNVVIDRMHLDADQRSHFIGLGKQSQVNVHGVVLMASKDEVESRVRQRVNHPGKVEGVSGASIAVASLSRLQIPTYDEGIALICHSRQLGGKLWHAYQSVGGDLKMKPEPVPKTVELYNAGKASLPVITLGTMNMRKQTTSTTISQAIQLGFNSIDTAPTYNNEEEVGSALRQPECTKAQVTIKIPKRAMGPEKAREEVVQSLSQLQRSSVDVILLHWPCDFIEAGTLSAVWKELEAMKKEGLCRIIGVCNFSITALRVLLSSCITKPALNQVERHPMLPQYELLEYCDSQDIIVQAHSPLGNGNHLLLENETILKVARESNMSSAQVLLSWNLHQGVPVVTKCSSERHQKETVALLQEPELALSPQQMKAIDGMSSGTHRFVAPPFMYRKGAAYSWGDSPPAG